MLQPSSSFSAGASSNSLLNGSKGHPTLALPCGAHICSLEHSLPEPILGVLANPEAAAISFALLLKYQPTLLFSCKFIGRESDPVPGAYNCRKHNSSSEWSCCSEVRGASTSLNPWGHKWHLYSLFPPKKSSSKAFKSGIFGPLMAVTVQES